MNSKTKRKHLFDFLLLLGLLTVGILCVLVMALTREDGEYIKVRHNGEVIMELSLSRDGEYSLLDGKNVFVIEGGEVYMLSADCPKKICVNEGRKHLVGDVIECRENKILIQVVKDGEDIFVS